MAISKIYPLITLLNLTCKSRMFGFNRGRLNQQKGGVKRKIPLRKGGKGVVK